MRFKSLGSGSTGNATVVQSAGPNGCNVLIDCGFGLKSLLAKLEQSGVQPEVLNAIFITHEHGDHVGCALGLSTKYQIPIWTSAGTSSAAGFDGSSSLVKKATDGCTIDLGGLQITPFTVPHDASAPLQLTCTDGNAKLGILTDLGHATDHVMQHLRACTALLLECNHDSDMLLASNYPAFLKQRVGGNYGHLSNDQGAAIAQAVQHSGLRHVVAAHLSQQNNRPELVATSLAQALSCGGQDILIASADGGCPWLDV
jgi:phosphoribosyl 1,2-cyclic phosphodiesterase